MIRLYDKNMLAFKHVYYFTLTTLQGKFFKSDLTLLDKDLFDDNHPHYNE